ncbi:MAG: PAS domain S-box protein [Anaerolineaceae bacterium]|jgi:diguanylate cyclase (GGDEF)-like protein/PAS domain S-box-containing protein
MSALPRPGTVNRKAKDERNVLGPPENRRNSILETLSFFAEQFLRTKELDETVHQSLERLGKALAVSRSYIYRNVEENNKLISVMEYEWTDDGVMPLIKQPNARKLDFQNPDVRVMRKTLQQGKYLIRKLPEMKGVDPQWLKTTKLKSLVAMPIFVENKWWGFIGFDECKFDRTWDTTDLDTLRTVADVFGAAIELKDSEKALNESEVRYRSLFEDNPVALLEEDFSMVKTHLASLSSKHIKDLRNYLKNRPKEIQHCISLVKINDANRAALQLFKAKSKEALLLSLPRLLPLDMYDFFLEELVAIYEEKSYFKGELVNYTLDGKPVSMNLAWTISPESRETYEKVIVSVENITERKEAEKALRESEEKFRNIVEQTMDGVTLFSTSGKILEWNHGMEIITGLKQTEVMGKSILNVMAKVGPPSSRIPHNIQLMKKTLLQIAGKKSNEPAIDHSISQTIVRADGSVRYVQIITFPIQLYEQTLYGSFARDVTDQRMADEELHTSTERFRLLAENATDVITLYNPDSSTVYISPSIEHLLGYTPDQLLGKDPFEVLHPDDINKLKELQLVKYFKNTRRPNFECRARHADGHYVWIESTMQPITTPRGDTAQFVCISRDISERKQVEKELQDTRQALSDQVKLLEHRASEISNLADMVNMLQKCTRASETYTVFSEFSPMLFPNVTGSLIILLPEKNLMQVQSSWGKPSLSGEEFYPSDCWGYRLRKMYLTSESNVGPTCEHIGKPIPSSSLCVPIEVENEIVGLLNIQTAHGTVPIANSTQQLAQTVVEQLSLALANLKLQERLREQAIRDPLTGLYNRYFMEESLIQELHRAERNAKTVSLIMLDFDHFKELNTQFGHPNVDEMLREFGKLLKNSIRAGDIACRYGGDEFLVILPDANSETAMQRAEQLRQRVKTLAVRSEDSYRYVTVSIGVACWPQHGRSAFDLLRAADTALFQAKVRNDSVVLMG